LNLIKEILIKNITLNSISDPQCIISSIILKAVLDRRVDDNILNLIKEYYTIISE
jgi:hypothetical protein